MEFRILGPLQAFTATGRPVPIGGPRQQLVLAALVLANGRTVPMDLLIETVWGSEPPASARTQIAIAISGLRRVFAAEPDADGDAAAEVIETVAPGYRLRAEAVRVDVREAEARLAEARAAARAGRPDEAILYYRSALSLWQGPVLPGLDRSTIAPRVLPLEELRLAVHEEAAELALARGQHRTLISELLPVVAGEPYRERLRGFLMLALVRAGRQSEALAVYREGRNVLADELGLDPGRELRELHEAILRDDPALYAPPVSPIAPRLPMRPTGRRPAMAAATRRNPESGRCAGRTRCQPSAAGRPSTAPPSMRNVRNSGMCPACA